jgi:hypothetical protein
MTMMIRAQAFAIGLLLMGHPASAQVGGGSPQGSPPTPYRPVTAPNAGRAVAQSTDALAVEALRNYAACAVKRTPDGAAKLLNTPDANIEPALRRFAVGHEGCGTRGARLAFGSLPFRGDLAEALIAQRYADRSIVTAAQSTEVKSVNEPEAVGLCIVQAKPEAAAALLRSSPGSEDEHLALNQTVDVLPGCVRKGQTIKMNRPAARAIMALGTYRLLAGNPEPAES